MLLDLVNCTFAVLPRYKYIPNNTSAVSVLLAPVFPYTFKL